MFPLGSVLLPGMALPLHVFEPRFRDLVQHCLGGDQRFGVVLIERGSEVGGGDVRTDVGTVAQIVEAVSFDDGRWAIGAVGTQRFRVLHWLPDDPYPRAEVELWPEAPGAEVATDDLAALERELRRALALKAELGEPAAPATFELAADAVRASFQAVGVAPLGPIDRQALLEIPGTAARIRRLHALVVEEARFLDRRLELERD